jgi:hypothetical protein
MKRIKLFLFLAAIIVSIFVMFITEDIKVIIAVYVAMFVTGALLRGAEE